MTRALALIGLIFASSAAAIERPAPLPKPLAPRTFKLPAVQEAKLSNGISVRVIHNGEVPTFAATLVFKTGAHADPVGKEGTIEAMFDMLDEGAGGRDATKIARALKRLASRLGTSAADDRATISTTGLVRNLEPTLDIWADVLLRPDFPEDAWALLQQRRAAALEVGLRDPATVAGRITSRAAYGDAWRGRLTTPTSLKAITLDDVKQAYKEQLSPENTLIIIGGDVTLAQVLPLLEARLGNWKPADAKPTQLKTTLPAATTSQIYVVDIPGSTQSVVQAVHQLADRKTLDRQALAVANQAFARAFTGRVNMNLREDKGWTYGARCNVNYAPGHGIYLCNAAVRADVTGPSITEIRREMAEVLGDRPLTTEEVTTYVASLSNGFPLGFETLDRLFGHEVEVFIDGESRDYLATYLSRVRAVTPEAANAALRTHLQPSLLQWIVVGDLATIRPQLQTLGLPIVTLDRNAQPVTGQP